jgi:hypothetical protein
VWQGKRGRGFRRANFIVFPVFVYCLGGYFFNIFFASFPTSLALAYSGIFTFTVFALTAFFLLPRSFAVTQVPIPAALDFKAEAPAMFFLAAAAHAHAFFGRAKLKKFTL